MDQHKRSKGVTILAILLIINALARMPGIVYFFVFLLFDMMGTTPAVWSTAFKLYYGMYLLLLAAWILAGLDILRLRESGRKLLCFSLGGYLVWYGCGFFLRERIMMVSGLAQIINIIVPCGYLYFFSLSGVKRQFVKP